jgi:hypothetical protein
MIKVILTPAHADPLEPLLNQPLAGTFHHAGAEGNLLLSKLVVFHLVVMALKVVLYLDEGV